MRKLIHNEINITYLCEHCGREHQSVFKCMLCEWIHKERCDAFVLREEK